MRLPTRGQARIWLTAAAVAAVVAGCGGSQLPTVLSAAPEPGNAPPPGVRPAGTVVLLGASRPEGVVVDGSSRYVVIAIRDPDRLLVLDTSSLQVVATVAAPGSARHLELAGPEQVIVPGEDTDTVSVLTIPGGELVSQVRVGHQPHDAQQLPDGTIVSSIELGSAVTASLGDRVLGTVSGPIQPGGVAQSAGLAAVVDVRGRLLYVYADDPLRVVGRVAVGAGPTHAVGLGSGVVAVADTSGNRVFLVRITGKPTVLTSLAVPGQPYGLAVDPARHRLWVAGSGNNSLREYAITGSVSALTLVATFPTVQQPNSLAVIPATGDVVVVGATSAGSVELISPAAAAP